MSTEMGTMSSRGQICIPRTIREEMGLEEGKKVLFSSYNGSLTLTPVDEEILKILRKVSGSGRELSPAEKRRRQKELKTMTQSELARKFGFNNL